MRLKDEKTGKEYDVEERCAVEVGEYTSKCFGEFTTFYVKEVSGSIVLNEVCGNAIVFKKKEALDAAMFLRCAVNHMGGK